MASSVLFHAESTGCLGVNEDTTVADDTDALIIEKRVVPRRSESGMRGRESWRKTRDRAFRDPERAVETLTPYASLHLNVIEAVGLLPADVLGAADPYVQVFVNDVLQETSTHRTFTLEPSWNWDVSVDIWSPFTIVRVQVTDWDFVTSDDMMGFVEFCVADLGPGTCECGHVFEDDATQQCQECRKAHPAMAGWFELRRPEKLVGRARQRFRRHRRLRDDLVHTEVVQDDAQLTPTSKMLGRLRGYTNEVGTAMGFDVSTLCEGVGVSPFPALQPQPFHGATLPGKLLCPQGHCMKIVKPAPMAGLVHTRCCDVCGEVLGRSQPRRQCKACDYDACTRCAEKALHTQGQGQIVPGAYSISAGGGGLLCPQGHCMDYIALGPMEGFATTRLCDVCGEVIIRPQSRNRCKTCDVDVCNRCTEKAFAAQFPDDPIHGPYADTTAGGCSSWPRQMPAGAGDATATANPCLADKDSMKIACSSTVRPATSFAHDDRQLAKKYRSRATRIRQRTQRTVSMIGFGQYVSYMPVAHRPRPLSPHRGRSPHRARSVPCGISRHPHFASSANAVTSKLNGQQEQQQQHGHRLTADNIYEVVQQSVHNVHIPHIPHIPFLGSHKTEPTKSEVPAQRFQANAGEIHMSLVYEVLETNPHDDWYACCLPKPEFHDSEDKKQPDMYDVFQDGLHIKRLLLDQFLVRLLCICNFVSFWKSKGLTGSILAWWWVCCLHPFFFLPSLPIWFAVWLGLLRTKAIRERILFHPSSASLDDEGFVKVASLGDSRRMAEWVHRVVIQEGWTVSPKDVEFRRYASLVFRDKRPLVSFVELKEDLAKQQWVAKGIYSRGKHLASSAKANFAEKAPETSVGQWITDTVMNLPGKVGLMPHSIERAKESVEDSLEDVRRGLDDCKVFIEFLVVPSAKVVTQSAAVSKVIYRWCACMSGILFGFEVFVRSSLGWMLSLGATVLWLALGTIALSTHGSLFCCLKTWVQASSRLRELEQRRKDGASPSTWAFFSYK